MMTKPVPLLVQVCSDQFTLRRLGRITQAAVVFGWAATYVDWTPVRVLVALSMVVSGAVLFFSIFPREVMVGLTFVVPVAFVNWYPALFILGRDDPFGMPSWMQLASPPAA